MNNKNKQRLSKNESRTSKKQVRNSPQTNNNQPKLDLRRDSWLATLANPWAVQGVRIPDSITYPSATCSFRQRFTVNPLAATTGSGYGFCVMFNPTVYQGITKSTAYNQATGTFTVGGTTSLTGYTTLATLCRAYRIVSAGIAVTSSTAMAANQGRYLCASYPGNDTQATPFTTSVDVASLLIAENSEDSPLNQQKVCSINWFPSDESNYGYHRVDSNAFDAAGPETPKYYNPGTLIWACDGVDQKASFEVTLVVNVEYQPLQNYIGFVMTMPSTYSVIAMQRALNSPMVSRIFGTANPEDVYVTTANDNYGLANVAGQLLSTFGSGASSVLTPFTYNFGRALAWGGVNYLNNRLSVRRQLLGIDY